VAAKSRKKFPGNNNHDLKAFSRYQEVVGLMERDFLKLRSVAQLARVSKLSVSYISRLFKRFGNSSPYGHLLQIRMQFAAKALTNPKTHIHQVVKQLEFTNQYHFSRVFKRCIGVSPARFQKRMK
jgi:AraC-like DNA-binding protein